MPSHHPSLLSLFITHIGTGYRERRNAAGAALDPLVSVCVEVFIDIDAGQWVAVAEPRQECVHLVAIAPSMVSNGSLATISLP